MEHTVLVVEDEQGIREAIAIYLKNQGYQVLLAENGKEGLDLIHTNDVHLAIVDIMMPIMDLSLIHIFLIRKLSYFHNRITYSESIACFF